MGFGRSGLQRRPQHGWQRHHILPRALLLDRLAGPVVALLQSCGRPIDDFDCNGIWLPATEALALSARRPLHRGPHPQYNAVVRFRVLEAALGRPRPSPRILLRRLTALQRDLRASLTCGPPVAILNQRDPLCGHVDFGSVDDQVDRLYAATEPPGD